MPCPPPASQSFYATRTPEARQKLARPACSERTRSARAGNCSKQNLPCTPQPASSDPAPRFVVAGPPASPRSPHPPDPWSWQAPFHAVRWLPPQSEDTMARKTKLTQVAVKIGAAMGRADRKAHQIAKAGVLAKKELADISKQVDALKRQLRKTTKRLKRALA